jgi:hypothetical protein
MATDQLKILIAQEVAIGMKQTEIARLHNYTPAGIYKLLRTPEMVKLIKDEKDLRAARRRRAQILLDEHQPDAARTVVAIANDTEHKDCLKACALILGDDGHVTKREVEGRVEVNIAGDVLGTFKHTMEKLGAVVEGKVVPAIEDHLLEGEAALPQAIDLETLPEGDPLDPTTGNDSGNPT